MTPPPRSTAPDAADDDERKAKRAAYVRAWREANAEKVKAQSRLRAPTPRRSSPSAAYRAANAEMIKAKAAYAWPTSGSGPSAYARNREAQGQGRPPYARRAEAVGGKAHEPPREGLRPRPHRAAGPQRQGPRRRLRDAPGAPATASRASTRGRSPAPSWTSWAPCCGAFHNAHYRPLLPQLRGDRRQGRCARSTVSEAIKVLELAGVLTWQNRITRVRERQRDLFGRGRTGAGG